MATVKPVTGEETKTKPTYENTSIHVDNIVKNTQKQLGYSNVTPAFEYIVKNFDMNDRIKKPAINAASDSINIMADRTKDIVKNSGASDKDKNDAIQYLNIIKNKADFIIKTNNERLMPNFPNLTEK